MAGRPHDVVRGAPTMARRKEKRPPTPAPEFTTPWWVAGYTPAGFPYPAEPPEDLDEDAMWAHPDELPRGAWARDVLHDALALAAPSTRVEVGRPDRLGGGLSREAWRARVHVVDGDDALGGDWVVLLPDPGAPGDPAGRRRNEVVAMAEVRAAGVPFRVPEVLAAWEDEAGTPLLVERFVPGIPLDLRAGRQSGRPWERVGRIAATVHATPTTLPGPPTRRAFALAELAAVRALPDDVRVRAEAWCEAHLPPEAPTTLLHGDLLGPNILRGVDEPDAVIDWEYARRGDPAYDLAVVTRGHRRPFGLTDGLPRLLGAWHDAGGDGIRPEHVHLYEIALLATQVHARVHDARQRLDALLRRVGA